MLAGGIHCPLQELGAALASFVKQNTHDQTYTILEAFDEPMSSFILHQQGRAVGLTNPQSLPVSVVQVYVRHIRRGGSAAGENARELRNQIFNNGSELEDRPL